MSALSRGEPIIQDGYLFFQGQDWLMGIGYPLLGSDSQASFERVANDLAARLGASEIFAIAPRFSESLRPHVIESDRFYVLSANAPVPARLVNPVKKARSVLEITESSTFTPAHRKLWREFLERRQSAMSPRVLELYAATPRALLAAGKSLALLNAFQDGNLVACLLLDYSPANFTSYVLGAHSSAYYVPHAVDALFSEMLENSRARGKRFIHLGLGVNAGILRFKRKWGAVPARPFLMAQWQARTAREADAPFAATVCKAILRSGSGESARQLLANEPVAKPFAMLWEVSKNGRTSWLGGTAHFFLHSFEPSFRKLFQQVENVLFEGPLDADFMAQVNAAGSVRPNSKPSVLSRLDDSDVERLQKVISGRNGFWAPALSRTRKTIPDARHLLATAWPWHVFFTLWTTFLENLGWKQSVDMEAWRLAHEMGKNVIAMENLEEQLESLQSLPLERAVSFFKASHTWRKRASQNLGAYLAGDLEKMMGSSAEFPTRTEHIVGRRDQRFRERMRPWLEKGDSVVFVGSAHLVNLRHMLAEDGFAVRQKPFGIIPKIKLGWRKMTRPDEKVKW